MNLGLASGNLYKLFFPKDQNKIIEFFLTLCKKYNFNSYELTYSCEDELEIDLNDKSIKFLKALECVSIHYPFHDIIEDNEQTRRIFKKINQIYHETDSKLIVTHPEQVKNWDFVKNLEKEFDVKIVTELQIPSKFHLDGFDKLLSKVDVRFVFDIGHAEFHDFELLKVFFDKYSNRICEVHLNKVFDNKAHSHFFMHGASKTLELVKNLDVPMIIEEAFDPDKIEDIEKEIKYLLNYFLNPDGNM
ncbi:MAG: hypothetical protein ABIG93_04795 [archaeon]|nr:hypothetical protein [Nanoarchaeota archaeon]